MNRLTNFVGYRCEEWEEMIMGTPVHCSCISIMLESDIAGFYSATFPLVSELRTARRIWNKKHYEFFEGTN